jgi:hypothetical protein
MSPKPEDSYTVEHSPDPESFPSDSIRKDESAIKNGYTNDGYLNNELSVIPKLELTGDLKQNQQQPQPKQIIDFDDLLPYIGEFGRYQKILFLLMIPFAFFVAFVYFSQIFITLVPEEHWCRVPELQNLTVEQR